MKQKIVADIDTCQEFRIGETWYRALLPPLCRHTATVRWVLNLTTLLAQGIKMGQKIEELR